MNEKQKADFLRVIAVALFGVIAILSIPYLFHSFM